MNKNNMKYIITESQKDVLGKMVSDNGLEYTSKLIGGIDNLVKVLYDGDIKKFSEEANIKLVDMSTDSMNMYIHEVLVLILGLENYRNRKEKKLGSFRYGAKNGVGYRFDANLMSVTKNNQPYYKVVGTSGDSGFGYSFINKKNILGKRYRQQIFNQIIDKYKLQEYL